MPNKPIETKQVKKTTSAQEDNSEKYPVVKYTDLIRARVRVVDGNGHLYYLEPSLRGGEYMLKPLSEGG